MFVLKWVARVLLFFMGWHLPSEELVKSLSEVDTDQVLLGQHTSYWDVVFTLLYCWAFDVQSRFKYLMAESIKTKFWYLIPLFHATGCVFVPSVNGKNQGGTQAVIDAINADPTKRKIILIAPNGSTKGSTHSRWRSGWYYIAKGIDAKVGTLGLNYHPLYRTITYNVARPLESSYEETVLPLRAEMAEIYPKFPKESSVHPLIPHPDHPTPAIDLVLLSSLVGLTLLPMWLTTEYDLFFVAFVSGICSAKYHFDYEQNNFWKVLDVRVAVFTLLYFQYKIITKFWGNSAVQCLNVINLFLAIYFFTKGCFREDCVYRSKKYINYHTLFHFMGLLNMIVYEYGSYL